MKNFAELITEIEQATESLADESTDLEEALDIYKKTLPLIQEAQQQLDKFKLEIKELAPESIELEA
ncbi:exodeoxyribonuclease VII small subunit [Candidatus Berkelbacteria bacterium]|nr:exodeoxyribonuclease VII small subunit [Candidatus Berkelbacteria bacterium]